MKRRLTVLGMAVVLLTGCSSKVPKLLTPVGEQEDTAIVTKGRNV